MSDVDESLPQHQQPQSMKSRTVRLPIGVDKLLAKRCTEHGISVNLGFIFAVREWLGLPKDQALGIMPPRLSEVVTGHLDAMEERLLARMTELLDPKGLRHVTHMEITGDDVDPETSARVTAAIAAMAPPGRLRKSLDRVSARGPGYSPRPTPDQSLLAAFDEGRPIMRASQLEEFQRQKDAFEPRELTATELRILNRQPLQPLPPVTSAEGHTFILPEPVPMLPLVDGQEWHAIPFDPNLQLEMAVEPAARLTKAAALERTQAAAKDNHVQAMIALAKTADRLQGTEWVLHGTLPLSHDQIGDCLKSLGARVPGCVTKKTRVLVAGDNASTEILTRAEQHCVEIWDGEMIMQFIRAADPTVESK